MAKLTKLLPGRQLVLAPRRRRRVPWASPATESAYLKETHPRKCDEGVRALRLVLVHTRSGVF